MSPRRKACLRILTESREALTLCRQAMYHMREAWIGEAESDGMADDVTTIFVARALGMATQHVALIGGFLTGVARFVDAEDNDMLEMHLRTGVEHWGQQPELIRAADEAWRKGEHVRLGRKRA